MSATRTLILFKSKCPLNRERVKESDYFLSLTQYFLSVASKRSVDGDVPYSTPSNQSS